MFLIYLFNFLKGYVIIKVQGEFLERFLNICTHRQIYLWDIKRSGQMLTAKVSLSGYRLLRGAAFKTKTKVRVSIRKGLPFSLHKSKKRKALWIGSLAFLAIIFYLASHVWLVEVTGNEKISKQELLKSLEQCGLRTGIFVWQVDADRLQQDMLKKQSGLSWLWVYVKGTKALVEVKERIPKPNIVPNDVPCNVIAMCDGIIERFLVKEGLPVVKQGMSVAKGQLLVSGVMESKTLGVRFVRADALATARTYRHANAKQALVHLERRFTGKTITKNKIKLFGMDLNLYIDNNVPFKAYDVETSENQISIGNNMYIPFYRLTQVYKEVELKEQRLALDKTVENMKNQLLDTLKKEIGEGQILNTAFELDTSNEQAVTVKLSAECSEIISMQVEINK